MVIDLSSIYSIESQGCEKMYIRETINIRLRTNVHRDHVSKNVGLIIVSVDPYMNAHKINPLMKM